MDSNTVDNQTKILTDTSNNLIGEYGKYRQLSAQQSDMYESIKFVNAVLIAFYIFVFLVLHILLFKQYIEGVPRNEWKDTIWLTIFFLYPYMIYMIEIWIYKAGLYIWSMITGTVYIPKFHRLFVMSDYYNDRFYEDKPERSGSVSV